jgi:hypothetical protein
MEFPSRTLTPRRVICRQPDDREGRRPAVSFVVWKLAREARHNGLSGRVGEHARPDKRVSFHPYFTGRTATSGGRLRGVDIVLRTRAAERSKVVCWTRGLTINHRPSMPKVKRVANINLDWSASAWQISEWMILSTEHMYYCSIEWRDDIVFTFWSPIILN